MEKLGAPESQIVLDRAKRHVRESIVPVVPGRRCVDGRYQPGQATGMLARPGGDFGYVMVLLALRNQGQIGLSPEQCANAIYEILSKQGSKLYMHTHSDLDPKDFSHIGCGHIEHAMDQQTAGMYGVLPTEVHRALRHTRERALFGAQMGMLTLSGEHEEQGVLIVTGTQRTVMPLNKSGDSMYFVYDQTRDGEFMENLVFKLRMPRANPNDFKAVADRQLQATLQILAPEKPIFEVDVDAHEPAVEHIGYVEALRR